MNIQVLFENEDLLAVAKPEGIASIPERDRTRPCLLTLLASRTEERLYVVHRLDKEASGVIVFAKSAAAHRTLCTQFEGGEVEKAYLALTNGVVREDRGVIEKRVRQYGSGRMGVDERRGKPSRTEYLVLERLAAHTLLDARPVTGRRHQIRVHLYSIGHPIVGDRRYGDPAAAAAPRLMLHARHVALQLPSGQRLRIEAPVPESFSSLLETLNATTLPAI